jgi:uncharacterized protein with NRDE domain
MCLIFFAINHHPDYKLIIAANRDEFYQRNTAPAHFWNDNPNILGGRDLEAAGTWMAMSKTGKISMVTNYRDPANINPKAPSRGQLVSDYLTNGAAPNDYLEQLAPKAALYNGYNLLVGYPDELWYHSNYGNEIQRLSSGVYGLSNHLLDTPWPKVTRGKEKFRKAITSDSITPEDLFQLLYDEQRASDQQLPDTGIGLERERALSSMFIKTNGYGTRCSTVITISQNNEVTFAERVYDLDTFAHQTNRFDFVIQ